MRSHRQPRVRVGVVGLRRGATFAQIAAAHPDAHLAALCDHDPSRLAWAADAFDDLQPTRCNTFEQLLDSGVDAVILANDATAHTALAVTALAAGIHVFSEVPATATMAEAVQLVEAAESSRALYMMAENYCFGASASEMRRRFQAGDLGEFQHGEGEYVHDTEHVWARLTKGRKDHWRNWRPSTFYCTHSIGPLLHITGQRVTRVVAMETPNRVGHRYGRLHGDSAVLICQTSGNGTLKSLQSHGGLKREPPSTWLAVYGTQGSMETNRWDRSKVTTFIEDVDGSSRPAAEHKPQLGGGYDLTGYEELAAHFSGAHGGSDFMTTHTFLQAVLGRSQVPIDAYRASDMSIPGLLGFRSIMTGNTPVDVPDLRDASARDFWRHDSWGVAQLHSGTQAPPPSSSFGVPDVPDEVYQRQRDSAAATTYPPVERM